MSGKAGIKVKFLKKEKKGMKAHLSPLQPLCRSTPPHYCLKREKTKGPKGHLLSLNPWLSAMQRAKGAGLCQKWGMLCSEYVLLGRGWRPENTQNVTQPLQFVFKNFLLLFNVISWRKLVIFFGGGGTSIDEDQRKSLGTFECACAHECRGGGCIILFYKIWNHISHYIK